MTNTRSITQELNDLVADHSHRFNQYQLDFLVDMIWRLENERSITVRQQAYLEELMGKMRVWQRLQHHRLRNLLA